MSWISFLALLSVSFSSTQVCSGIQNDGNYWDCFGFAGNVLDLLATTGKNRKVPFYCTYIFVLSPKAEHNLFWYLEWWQLPELLCIYREC